MAKNKTKTTTKNKTKKTQEKKHKLSDISLNPFDFIKKYPGLFVAIIFSLIVIALLLSSITINDPELDERIYYSQQIHLENTIFVEETRINVIAELDGEYEDTLEDDYLVSMIHDLDWFGKTENELYNSKPIDDVLVKEIAISAFRSKLIEVNEQMSFDIFDLGQDYTIQTALTTEPLQNVFSEEELLETFGDNTHDKEIFVSTLNQIIKEYYNDKKEIIKNSTSVERQFVEAKKIMLFSY